MLASFDTAAWLTLLLPLALLIAVGIWWVWAARRRDEFGGR
jgi:hypothetical protein